MLESYILTSLLFHKFIPLISSQRLRHSSSSIQNSSPKLIDSHQFTNLVWFDEFDDGIGGDWSFDIGGHGWGENELVYYRRENAYTKNGFLIIAAISENYGGKGYTSARLKTQGKKSWRYGRIEARIRVPSFQGAWPSFWMMGDAISWNGWPDCGEIDIMETVNSDNKCFGTVHWSDQHGRYAKYENSVDIDISLFHNYAVEWTSSSIRWFVDDHQYHNIDIRRGKNGTSEFQMSFFILLNLAVGGSRPGNTVDVGALPAFFMVDYVRVYQ